MDIVGALFAAVQYFIAHWSEVEGLARSIAVDLTALWVLGLGLAEVLRPFFPKFSEKLESKVLGVVKH